MIDSTTSAPEHKPVEALPIHSEHIRAVWPKVEGFLSDASAGDPRMSPVDIRDACEDARMQMFVVWDGVEVLGVLVTEVLEGPRAKILNLAYVGGNDIESWKHWLQAIERWAAQLGCTHAELTGRKGWVKVLPDYTETARVLRKEI